MNVQNQPDQITDGAAARNLLARLADKYGSGRQRPYAEMLSDVIEAIAAARRRGREEAMRGVGALDADAMRR